MAFHPRQKSATQLDLHGNVDLRQVNLSFNNSERIAAVLVQEGDHVQRTQLVARLDTSRLDRKWPRPRPRRPPSTPWWSGFTMAIGPEEIAQARANVAVGQGRRRQRPPAIFERMTNLQQTSSGRAASQQDMDNAKAGVDAADAKLAVSQKSLELEVAGPRKEDIAQAEAQLQANEAQLAFLRQQLADSPTARPVRCRSSARA